MGRGEPGGAAWGGGAGGAGRLGPASGAQAGWSCGPDPDTGLGSDADNRA